MASIHHPSLTLTFLGDDLQPNHASVQVIREDHIVRRSITFRQQLLSGLKSASNQVELLLEKTCPAIEDIIATEGDVKAVLSDGTTVLFTGYLSTSYSWTITHSGTQALAITIEDTGTRLLGKAFITHGRHLFNCSASEAIGAICQKAGITVSPSCIAPSAPVTRCVDGSLTCGELLEQLAYELGHAYHFDALGHLRLYKIDCTATDGIPVLDKDRLVAVDARAVTLAKQIRRYKSARVSFTRLGTASDYLVYRNTSGRSDGHPYCYLKLDGGQYFDGSELYTESEWTEARVDSFRNPALIEACNAASETQIVGGGRIIAVSNVRTEFTAESGALHASVTAAGGPYLEIHAHNGGALAYHLTRLDAYADIVYERDVNIIRTSGGAPGDENSDNQIGEELSFVHELALAQAHANLLAQYHRHGESRYTFYSSIDLPYGSLVRILDDAFSGLDVAVLITARTFTDESAVIAYEAVGVSAFDLDAPAHHQVLARGKGDTKGAAGPPGEDALQVHIISDQGTTFRMGQGFCTTLEARVFQGGVDVTGAYLDGDFRWYRTSSDSHADDIWNSAHYSSGGRALVITHDDVAGRSNFFCDLLTKRN